MGLLGERRARISCDRYGPVMMQLSDPNEDFVLCGACHRFFVGGTLEGRWRQFGEHLCLGHDGRFAGFDAP